MKLFFAILSITSSALAQVPSAPPEKSTKAPVIVVQTPSAKDLEYENKLLSIFGAPSFCSGALPEGIVERYRIIWARSFHPPIFFTISIGHSSKVHGTSALMDRIPSEGPVSRIESTWVDLCAQKPDDKTYCADFVEVLHKQANSLFWSEPFRKTEPQVINLDGSTWTIEGQIGKRCHIITRWSPDERSELFHFLMFLVNATGKRLYHDEVY